MLLGCCLISLGLVIDFATLLDLARSFRCCLIFEVRVLHETCDFARDPSEDCKIQATRSRSQEMKSQMFSALRNQATPKTPSKSDVDPKRNRTHPSKVEQIRAPS